MARRCAGRGDDIDRAVPSAASVRDGRGERRLAWLAWRTRARIAPPDARLLFLGLSAPGAAHFAIDIDDPARLEGLGRFDDLRALGPWLAR